MKDIVTISLETYKEMQDEINLLTRQVQEKVIYRDIMSPYSTLAIALLGMGLMIFAFSR